MLGREIAYLPDRIHCEGHPGNSGFVEKGQLPSLLQPRKWA
jgi:hypothetical protein